MIDAARRILFVHAHPDDESIGTGATMALYAADPGTHVTLVTCTLGEEGEIHVPALAQLEAAQADQLGGWRIAELNAACAALGVEDHRWLGGAGRYRDSGMMGLPTNDNPRAFWSADLDEAAAHLAEVVREVRPQVVVTYDANGFYGHPDHIQAHRVTVRAIELASADHTVDKLYYTTVARRDLAEMFDHFKQSAENPFAEVERVEDLPFGAKDEEIDARINATGTGERKLEALRAHASQIPGGDWMFTLAAELGEAGLEVEYYTLATGKRGPGTRTVEGGPEWETDLFAGLV
ncbi:N-acetyl-1-D-myo-inositol-2-amino-2-deoxy-alpha-D-glucopyranoside deacetylase [Phytomonospora endophytica]|uniref:1D-myo-inositol 2-acetamido-2-deoxy-alpha-D-glucopyranoside deacetylase n=1 Tax=Phytomonospora endophytica TaxID=714109 RepID=A0A841FBS7_9ACTN|nr:N-acetyl-1-D-myo-inositol-2-amino-2-deoxy-alpha-D-glucopyranoside deacetylase [Phytomonospora endophytica]MBB6033244.1 N-acetyl-1-D-myo-inositol-2-amino-2-deoxy-alpha-D-glucopyranoside deacetylase [Phytomonospora endophytica]GIG65470.1 1D-myo-inositol 2-acetamido-2-deoxy-alpha-D-glucopyranoside deacetylase [Phytomonospora endophytica]